MGGQGSGRRKGQRTKQPAAPVVAPKGEPVKPPAVIEDATASAKWDATVEHLRSLGRLSPVDADLLEVYCLAYSRFTTLRPVVLTMEERRSPEQMEFHAAEQRIADCLDALALSPRARAKLPPVAEQKGDQLLRLVGRSG